MKNETCPFLWGIIKRRIRTGSYEVFLLKLLQIIVYRSTNRKKRAHFDYTRKPYYKTPDKNIDPSSHRHHYPRTASKSAPPSSSFLLGISPFRISTALFDIRGSIPMVATATTVSPSV